MRTIPVDLILHELAARLAELPDTQHRDLHRAISRGCIRPQFLAEEWTSGAGVAQQAAWLVRRLDGEDMNAPRLREIAAETRAMEVAVARRLADCALSLLVTQDPEDTTAAQTLLQTAQRVVGLATAKSSAEEARPASATDGAEDGAEDGLSPATLRHYLAATRCALGLGSGPVFLGDIVARAKALANAEAENANKASVIAKQESIIANLTRERDTWSAWATKLAGQGHEHSSSKALREALSARFIDSKGQRLKVARDCLPPNGDIIVCMHGNEPTTYRASNTDEEHDTPEAAVHAAWEHHLRPTQSATAPAFKVGDRIVIARKAGSEACPWELMDDRYLGQHGTIERQYKAGDLMVRLDLDGDCLWFLAASVDHVTPTA